MIRFDIYGRQLSVQRKADQWLLFRESDTGMRTRIYEVVIPDDLDQSELCGYLADIYHEFATDAHPEARQIS